MQRLEVRGAVRPLLGSLGVRGLLKYHILNLYDLGGGGGVSSWQYIEANY